MHSPLDRQIYDLIVIQDKANNSGGGIVSILFHLDTNDQPVELDRDVFKSGTCWVSSGYDEFIENKFTSSEPFIIRGARPQDVERLTNGPDGAADWWVSGKNSEKLNGKLVPILQSELPNIDSGIFDWRGDELQRGNYFILDKSCIYGLFDISRDTKDDRAVYKAIPIASPAIHIDTYHVSKVSDDALKKAGIILEAVIADQKKQYITSTKEFGRFLSNPRDQQIDYIPAKQLFSKYIAPIKDKKSNKRIMSKSDLSDVSAMLTSFLESSGDSLRIGSDRYNRALGLLRSIKEPESWETLIKEYLETPEGKDSVTLFAQDIATPDNINKDQLIELEVEIEQAKIKLKELDRNCDNRTHKKHNLEQEILDSEKALEIKIEHEKSRINLEISDQLAELKCLTLKNDTLKSEGEQLEKKYSCYNKLDELLDEIGNKEKTLEYIRDRVKTQKKLLNDPDYSGDEVVKVHTIMDLLGYRNHIPKRQIKDDVYKYTPPNQAQDIHNISPSDFVASICEKIRSLHGRELSQTETANLLICMQQNLLIFLQGKPGKGKTSTALNLAVAMGIHSHSTLGMEPDFISISVARGWSASRDLIGFYNSLRGEFQPSQTGLYQFLLDGESLNNESNMRLVLLDEANLSPIEHYFSSFILLFDKEGKNKFIDTGCIGSDQRYIHPVKNNNLRFIATINNDATTESLSPRLLDRSPVISMDIDDNVSLVLNGEISDFSGAVSANYLESTFGREYDGELEEINLSNLDEFLGKGLSKAPSLTEHLHLEGRRKLSISSYIHTASVKNALMERSVAEDFAVAQFLLPHFRGDGACVSEAISEMIKFADNNNWERTSQILNRISREGDGYLHSYSFM